MSLPMMFAVGCGSSFYSVCGRARREKVQSRLSTKQGYSVFRGYVVDYYSRVRLGGIEANLGSEPVPSNHHVKESASDGRFQCRDGVLTTVDSRRGLGWAVEITAYVRTRLPPWRVVPRHQMFASALERVRLEADDMLARAQ